MSEDPTDHYLDKVVILEDECTPDEDDAGEWRVCSWCEREWRPGDPPRHEMPCPIGELLIVLPKLAALTDEAEALRGALANLLAEFDSYLQPVESSEQARTLLASPGTPEPKTESDNER